MPGEGPGDDPSGRAAAARATKGAARMSRPTLDPRQEVVGRIDRSSLHQNDGLVRTRKALPTGVVRPVLTSTEGGTIALTHGVEDEGPLLGRKRRLTKPRQVATGLLPTEGEVDRADDQGVYGWGRQRRPPSCGVGKLGIEPRSLLGRILRHKKGTTGG